MRMSYPLVLLIVMVMLTFPLSAKNADQDSQLGTFGQWRAYTTEQNSQRVCYMVLTPPAFKNKDIKRGAAYLMVTHRPSEGSVDVVSYRSGYNFKPVDDVKIKVGSNDFTLFSDKDTAWTRDARTDHALALAIRSNKSLIVTGVPALKKSSPISDVLDLTGADRAYHAISRSCGTTETAINPISQPKKQSTTSKF